MHYRRNDGGYSRVAPHRKTVKIIIIGALIIGALLWCQNYAKAETIYASITNYSPTDSCHYKNRKGECLTASGLVAREGLAACPRSIPFGTRIRVANREYTCADRTAQWVQRRYGATFDLYVNSYKQAINFGRKQLKVEIL